MFPLPVDSEKTYSLTVRLSRQLTAAGNGRLLLVADGNIDNATLIWENPAGFDENNQLFEWTLTTEAGSSDLQLLAEGVLDDGPSFHRNRLCWGEVFYRVVASVPPRHMTFRIVRPFPRKPDRIMN